MHVGKPGKHPTKVHTTQVETIASVSLGAEWCGEKSPTAEHTAKTLVHRVINLSTEKGESYGLPVCCVEIGVRKGFSTVPGPLYGVDKHTGQINGCDHSHHSLWETSGGHIGASSLEVTLMFLLRNEVPHMDPSFK